MTNKYFPEDGITFNDLYFVCYMIERVARRLHQHNAYVVNTIGKDELYHLLSVADALHCENPLDVEDTWIQDYVLQPGCFDIAAVDHELCSVIPSETSIGKVYARLIRDTLLPDENYVDGIMRVYNNEISETIDNYNGSAYYEPSYVIVRAYNEGGFN